MNGIKRSSLHQLGYAGSKGTCECCNEEADGTAEHNCLATKDICKSSPERLEEGQHAFIIALRGPTVVAVLPRRKAVMTQDTVSPACREEAIDGRAVASMVVLEAILCQLAVRASLASALTLKRRGRS